MFEIINIRLYNTVETKILFSYCLYFTSSDCSGLAIVSRFPFKEVEFNAYTYRGDPAKMFVDGEWFSRKGAGRVQIEPLPNVTVV